jgi:hypothetical protein
LTDHITPDGFPNRPLSMKVQRWKHIVVEGRGEEGVGNCDEMKAIYREEGLKKRWESHNYSQKTCKNTFFNLTTAENV